MCYLVALKFFFCATHLLQGQGEKAFAVFERQVCFYTTFHDDSFARIGKPNQEKIHRTYKVITKDYPPTKPRAIFIHTETAISPGSLSSILE
jgi:hypothetical protein